MVRRVGDRLSTSGHVRSDDRRIEDDALLRRGAVGDPKRNEQEKSYFQERVDFVFHVFVYDDHRFAKTARLFIAMDRPGQGFLERDSLLREKPFRECWTFFRERFSKAIFGKERDGRAGSPLPAAPHSFNRRRARSGTP